MTRKHGCARLRLINKKTMEYELEWGKKKEYEAVDIIGKLDALEEYLGIEYANEEGYRKISKEK